MMRLAQRGRDFSHSPGSKVSREVLLLVTWICFFLATSLFITRIILRIRLNSRFHSDDYLAGLAWTILLAHGIVVTVMSPWLYDLLAAAAQDPSFVPGPDFADNASSYLKGQFTATFLFWTCLWTVKASFLAFFRQLTKGVKYMAWFWWFVVIVSGLGYIASAISYPLACSSFEMGGCNSDDHIRGSLVSLRLSTALDIITDVLIISIPIGLVYRVRLNIRTKLALVGVFLMGGFVILFAVVRIIVTNTVSQQPEPAWLNLWSAIECSVAVMVCCLTIFKQLLTRRQGGGYYGDSYPRGYGSRSRGNGGGRHPASHGRVSVYASGKVDTQVHAVPLSDFGDNHHQDDDHIVVTTNVSYSSKINESAQGIEDHWTDADNTSSHQSITR